jgi:hypothetical protein
MADVPDQKDPFGAGENYGIPRQHTQVQVIVHSHIVNNDLKGIVDCSADVTSLEMSKTIKGGGSASFSLQPRRNYLNYLFANDWVNIYVNPGDGRGFIRTFFGFVDRVERGIATDDTGATTTSFQVTCTDFTKAFEVTQIYFNPHIAHREDFAGNFAGTKNLGGAALRTKGIVAFGTPADIVLNLAHMLLGFKGQYIMPPTYPGKNAIPISGRNARLEWAKSIQSAKIQEAMGGATLTKWRTALLNDAEEQVQSWKQQVAQDVESRAAAGQIEGFSPALDPTTPVQETISKFIGKKAAGNTDPWSAARIVAIKSILDREGQPETALQNPEVKAGLELEAMASDQEAGSLMHLIDISFVEHKAIDGSLVSAPIWTQQGTLWSIMNSYSNDVVNELFCDLRPLSKEYEKKGVTKGGYAFEVDEHGLNKVISEFGGHTEPAVRFVPAIVMREYPHSTVHGVDAFNIRVLERRVGSVLFGGIFSQEANMPGRKVIGIKGPLNDHVRLVRPQAVCKKHLDVAVISVKDIISENVGRGDADVVNLIELYSDGGKGLGKHMKFVTQDIQPIVTPISVIRHGLRVRTYNTRFARFSSKVSSVDGVDSANTRHKLIRWVMMLDHWYQHNAEYLNGTFTTRAFPEIRVGYRIDVAERNESYYVEGVNHTWTYPGVMTTTFTVSRGQRNDPFPVYTKPSAFLQGDRKLNGRLSQVFRTLDPSAVVRAIEGSPSQQFMTDINNFDGNWVDDPNHPIPPNSLWGQDTDGYLVAAADDVVGAAQIKVQDEDGVLTITSLSAGEIASIGRVQQFEEFMQRFRQGDDDGSLYQLEVNKSLVTGDPLADTRLAKIKLDRSRAFSSKPTGNVKR